VWRESHRDESFDSAVGLAQDRSPMGEPAPSESRRKAGRVEGVKRGNLCAEQGQTVPPPHSQDAGTDCPSGLAFSMLEAGAGRVGRRSLAATPGRDGWPSTVASRRSNRKPVAGNHPGYWFLVTGFSRAKRGSQNSAYRRPSVDGGERGVERLLSPRIFQQGEVIGMLTGAKLEHVRKAMQAVEDRVVANNKRSSQPIFRKGDRVVQKEVQKELERLVKRP
jgi:hypothetical protein